MAEGDLQQEPLLSTERQVFADTGPWQSIARHWVFGSFVNLAVAAFVVHTGTSMGPSRFADHVYLVIFALAWFVRLAAFRSKFNAFRDFWFVYDGLIVCLMIIEQCLCFGNARNEAYLRVCQVLMLTPTLLLATARKVPELMVLIKGLIAALRSLFLVLSLLAFTTFIVGILLAKGAQDTSVGQKYFGSLGGAMHTLLLHGIFLDHVAVVGDALSQESCFLSIVFFAFIGLAVVLVVVALLVAAEVVSSVAKAEKESMIDGQIQESLVQLFARLDEAGDGTISQKQLLELLVDPAACEVLQSADIDVSVLSVRSADHLFGGIETPRTVSFSDFVSFALRLRGSSSTAAHEIIDLRSRLDARMDRMEQLIEALAGPAAVLTLP